MGEVESSSRSKWEDTLPKLLLRNCVKWGEKCVALRKKAHGIWEEYTWTDCYQKVKEICLGLLALGLQPGDTVSILGDNNPEWLWSELAVQAAGGMVVGVYAGASAQETEYVIGDSSSKFVIAQDQEQVDKLIEVKDNLPLLSRIVYWCEKGMRHYQITVLTSLAEVVMLGEACDKKEPERFERQLALGKGDDIAMSFYPLENPIGRRGVLATHQGLLSAIEAALACNTIGENDEYVCVSSAGRLSEQLLGFGAFLSRGQKLNFPESLETAIEDLREISPHTLAYSSEVWDQIASGIKTNLSGGSRINRLMYNLYLPVGYKMTELRLKGRESSLFWRSLNATAWLLLFRPLRDKHGLKREKVAYVTEGTVSQEVFRFFSAIGVNLQQMLGPGECDIVSGRTGQLCD